MKDSRTIEQYSKVADRAANDPGFFDHVLDLEEQAETLVDARVVLGVVLVSAILGGLLGVWIGSW